MCGRYTLASEADELIEAFDLPELTFELVPRYNIAPGQLAPVVAADRRGRRMGLMGWGFVPDWQDEPGAGFINARSETVQDKRSFREAFARRRCLLPADGFYEWKTERGVKTPFLFRPAKGGVISFAGIWERWTRSGAEPRYTFAILTTSANADVRAIHDRMPLLIDSGDYALWLDRGADEAELTSLMEPAPSGTLIAHPVTTRVNRVTEDDPTLIEPV